jgi:hypothetical protein
MREVLPHMHQVRSITEPNQMFQNLFSWKVEGEVRLMRWQALGAYKCLLEKFGPQRRPALLVSTESAAPVFMVARCILQVMCLLAAPPFFII